MKLRNILFLLIFLSLIFFLFKLIFIPSYYSTALACFEDSERLENIEVAGITSVNEEGEIKIKVFDDSEKTLIHELCHKNQIEKQRSYSCEKPILKYFNEVECYFSEYIFNIEGYKK